MLLLDVALDGIFEIGGFYRNFHFFKRLTCIRWFKLFMLSPVRGMHPTDLYVTLALSYSLAPSTGAHFSVTWL
jgi:hypothetical protein